MKEPKKTVHLQLSLPVYEQLAQLAQDNLRTLPGYIRQVLRLYLKHREEGQSEEDWWYFRSGWAGPCAGPNPAIIAGIRAAEGGGPFMIWKLRSGKHCVPGQRRW